jgi:uncharacterized protein
MNTPHDPAPDFLQRPLPLIGVLELLPLPGSSGWRGSVPDLLTRAEQEALALATGGVDAILIENTGDIPYRNANGLDPAAIILLATVVQRVQALTELPVGIHILPNDVQTALALFMHTQLDFIRLPLLLGARITAQGILNSDFSAFSDYRNLLQLKNLPYIITDLTADLLLPRETHANPQASGAEPLSLQRLSRLAQRLAHQEIANALVVSMESVDRETLLRLKEASHLPLWVQDVTSPEACDTLMGIANGVLLNTGVRQEGSITKTISHQRVNAFRQRVASLV